MESRTVAVTDLPIEAQALANLKALVGQAEKEELQKNEGVVTKITPLTAPTDEKKPVPITTSSSFQAIQVMPEKEDSFSESEEESIRAQFDRLQDHLEKANRRQFNARELIKLKNSFTTAAYRYQLDDDQKAILIKDMKAAADMLDAADAYYINAKATGNVSKEIKSDFENKFEIVLDCAKADTANKYEKARSIFIKIGIALSIVALGAAVGVIAAGASPFIAAGCLVAGVVFLAASAIALYRQSNCTFFGQTQKSHMKMADLAAVVLEPKKTGCFG